MANTLKPKRSSVAGNIPTTTNLSSGEMGVNMADQKVWINNGTSVVQIGSGKLSGLADVVLSSLATGQGLSWNGTNWVNSSAGSGTVTSVSGTGTVSGLTLTGSVTGSGSLTLGGTLSLTSGQVTTALGFTPYNATNPSGYITGSGNAATATALQTARTINGVSFNGTANITVADATKLPLSGGTLTGPLIFGNATSPNTQTIQFGDNTGWTLRYMTSVSGTPTERFRFVDTGAFNAVGAITQNGNQVLHAGNFSSYAPSLSSTYADPAWISSLASSKLTGTIDNARLNGGTYTINVTGNAGTATTLQTARTINGVSFNGSANITVADSTKLPLSGGTLSGGLVINSGSTNQLQLNTSTGTQSLWIRAGYDSDGSATPAVSAFNVQFQSSGSSGGTFSFVSGNTKVLAIGGSAVNSLVPLQQSGNQVLHAGNYSTYSPSYGYFDDYQRGAYRVIADHGSQNTWYIRSNGRFTWARAHDWSQSFDLDLGSGTTNSNDGWARFGQQTSNSTAGTWRGTRFVQYTGGTSIDGFVRAGRYYLGDDSNYMLNAGDGSLRVQTVNGYIDIGPKNSSWCHIYSDRDFYTNRGIWINGSRVLDAGNYTSYSPSLTGSGASGTWGISVTGSAATLTTGRTIAMTGDVTWASASFNGSTNVTGTATLAASGVTAGTYTNATVTVDSKGRITSASSGTGGGVSSFNTRTGAVTLSSGDVTAALGFTPYNSTNPSGYITSSGSITGAARSLDSSNYISRTGSSGNLNTDFSNTPAGTQRYQGDDSNLTNSPGGTWWIYENKRHSNGTNVWGTQVAWGWEDNSNRLMQRNVSGNSWSGWVEYLNTGGRTFSGNLTMSGNISGNSDERLKTNWREMPENFVARLAKVRVGIYDRLDEDGVTQVGVSAQSFQELLPQAIMTAKDELGTLAVSYGNAALASAVELAKDNVDLRARVVKLEALVSKLIEG